MPSSENEAPSELLEPLKLALSMLESMERGRQMGACNYPHRPANTIALIKAAIAKAERRNA